MGKKNRPRLINVEIAPGNRAAMESYIALYNHAPSRTTPKITYTDVVNQAIDQFLRTWAPERSSRRRARPGGKEGSLEKERERKGQKEGGR